MLFATSIATQLCGGIGFILLAIVGALQKVVEQPEDATSGGGWLHLQT